MIIHSLKLENIRSYQKQSIEFKEGSTLLSGDVGSGKSSILLAIEFALFGVLRGMLEAKLLLRHGTRAGKIELKFSVAQNQFTVIREMRKNNKGQVVVGQVKFFENNEEIPCTIEELKSKILSILGYPQELLKQSKNLLYRYTVYTPQEDMNYILTEKEMRINIMRKLFNLDKYQKINENAHMMVRTLKTKQQVLEGKIQLLLPNERTLEKVKEEVEVKNREVKEKEQQYELQQQVVKKTTEELLVIKKEWEANEQEKSKLDKLIGQLESIEKQRELKEKELVEREKQQAEVKKEESVQLQREREQVVTALLEKEQQLKLALTKKQEVEVQQKQEMDALSLLEQQSAAIEKEKEQVEQQKENIIKLNICPSCNQEVKEEYKMKIKQEKEKELQELIVKKQTLTEKESLLKESKEKTEQQIRLLREQENHVLQLAHLLRERKRELGEQRVQQIARKVEQTNIAVSLEEVQREVEQLQQIETKLYEERQVIQEYKQREQHIVSLKRDIEHLNHEAKMSNQNIAQQKHALKVLDRTVLEKKEEQREKERKEQQTIETVVVRLREQQKQLQQQQQSLTEQVMQLHKLNQEVSKLLNIRHWIENFFTKMVLIMEKKHLHTVHYNFNEAFSSWFSRFIDQNLSAHLDDSFSPLLEQNGYDTTLQHLSGGERASCALAYRLALNKVINKVIQNIHTKELLILDEPTDSFSSEQLNIVRDALKELQLKQIILVSHEEKVEGFVEHVIKVGKENHVSTITQSF